jgi:aldose 1-epimerase
MLVEAELVLADGEWQAVVSDFGASLRQLRHSGKACLWGYSGGPAKKGGQGDVLIPFPGRIVQGRYSFEGKAHQLKLNDKDGPNAIHGFLRLLPWKVVSQTSKSARFSRTIRPDEFEGYPFSITVEMEYSVSASNGLRCAFVIANEGVGDAPVGAGFHPYLIAGPEAAGIDTSEARIPADSFVEFGTDLLPTGRVLPVERTEWDYREWKPIASTRFNHCYTRLKRGADGLARAGLRLAGREVIVWMDGSFDYLVVYSGDSIPAPHARRGLAIEPMTCATDAFNHPDWGLRVLKPGERFSGSWGVC